MSPAATDQRQAHWLSRCRISSAANTPGPSAEIHRLSLQTLCVVGVAGNRRIKELGGFSPPMQSAEYQNVSYYQVTMLLYGKCGYMHKAHMHKNH